MVLKKSILALLMGMAVLSVNVYAKNTTSDLKTRAILVDQIPLIKANAIEHYYINVKHRFNGADFEQPPKNIKNIKLRNNVIHDGDILLTSKASDKDRLNTYLEQTPHTSELLASYVARMVNYNQGYTVPQNNGKYSKHDTTTIYQALLDELNYRFSTTPVNSVANYTTQKDIEVAYLYILSRLDEQEKNVFWQFINAHKVGNNIVIPEGVVIADVLNTYKIQLNFKSS